MLEDKKQYSEASGDLGETMGALEAIGTAIYSEQMAIDVYQRLAELIENQCGRIKFQSLAEDEKRHRRHLEERYAGESGGRPFAFDPDRVKRIDLAVHNQMGAVEAVELAIKAEEAAQAFYTQAAEKTADESGKRMFRSLAADEERHYELLLAEREALLGGFYWFTADEQRFMEG